MYTFTDVIFPIASSRSRRRKITSYTWVLAILSNIYFIVKIVNGTCITISFYFKYIIALYLYYSPHMCKMFGYSVLGFGVLLFGFLMLLSRYAHHVCLSCDDSEEVKRVLKLFSVFERN